MASLDDGDELSRGALEHALEEQNELTFDVLAKRIDETGQLGDKQRDDPEGGGQFFIGGFLCSLYRRDNFVSRTALDKHD